MPDFEDYQEYWQGQQIRSQLRPWGNRIAAEQRQRDIQWYDEVIRQMHRAYGGHRDILIVNEPPKKKERNGFSKFMRKLDGKSND